MDAASNTGVDYVREIRDEIIFTPATEGVKVYIIDEVHMLSEGAFNALLKTLEEPPAKVMFILATTEMRKVPATILSRCQRFDFRRIQNSKIASRLKYISENEDIVLDDDAAELIAKISQGGMRDAISLLELCAGDRERVTKDDVRDTAGVFGREIAVSTVRAISEKDCEKILDIVSEVYTSSKDIAVFMSDIISFYRDMTVQKALSLKSLSESTLFDLTVNEFEEVKELSAKFTYEKLIYHYKLLSETYTEISRSESRRIATEMTLLRLASDRSDLSLEALNSRLADLERKIMRMPADQIAASSVKESEKVTKTPATAPKASENAEKSEKAPAVNEKKAEGIKITRGLWNSVLEKFSSAEPSTAPFLKDSKVFSHGSELMIEVSNSFMKTMLAAVNAEAILLRIVREEESRFTTVSIKVNADIPSEASPIDELL